MRISDRWEPMYRFSLAPQSPADFQMANWFTSTHPRGRFARNLVGARVVGDTRVNLLNASLSVRHPDGTVEHRTLADARDLGEVLTGAMGLDLHVPVETIWVRHGLRRRGPPGEFERAAHSRMAPDYDAFFSPVTALVTPALLDAAAVGPGKRVLDVATGPGRVAAGAAARGAAATGVDLAPGMATLAQSLHPTRINNRNVGDFGARSRENGMALPISFDKNGDLLTR